MSIGPETVTIGNVNDDDNGLFMHFCDSNYQVTQEEKTKTSKIRSKFHVDENIKTSELSVFAVMIVF